MPRRQRPTDDATRVVRTLTGTHKLIIAIAATLATLYAGVNFVVDRALDRYERERQKIGRPEYTNNKQRVEKEIEKLHDKLERLDDRVDRIEARP